jgi:uncharacterized protein YjiS (DUF1127 family)
LSGGIRRRLTGTPASHSFAYAPCKNIPFVAPPAIADLGLMDRRRSLIGATQMATYSTNSHRTARSFGGASRATAPAILSTILAAALDAWHVLGVWAWRSDQRRRLERLDDHILRDVGLTRAEVDREIAKPFWQE